MLLSNSQQADRMKKQESDQKSLILIATIVTHQWVDACLLSSEESTAFHQHFAASHMSYELWPLTRSNLQLADWLQSALSFRNGWIFTNTVTYSM